MNDEKMVQHNTVWIPYNEYQLMNERFEKMSIEERMQEAYFFWNNFSMVGYEEWREQQNVKEETDVQTETKG